MTPRVTEQMQKAWWIIAFAALAFGSAGFGNAAHAAPVPPASLPDNRVLGDIAAPAPVAEILTADTSAGYARITVTFRAPTAVSASIADSVLTIRLAKPADADMVELIHKLANYVASARRDPDKLTYRFALGVPVALHTSTSGGRTVIDLVPDSFAGMPPDLPPPAPVQRQAIDIARLPAIRVRVGEFANFTRLVFDWPAHVAYTVYPGKGRVSVRFETLARPDFSMLESRSPAWVRNAGWHLDDKALVVEFDTDPDSSFHDSRDGNKVMIDVLAPRTDAVAYSASAAHAPQQTDNAPASTPAPTQVPTPVASPTQVANAPPAALVPVTPDQSPALEGGGPPTATLQGDGAILRFPQARGHAVAVFVRGETTWIVLDAHPALEAATLFSNITSIVSTADTSQVGNATVVRLRFKSPLVATVSEDNAALSVTFAATAEPPRAFAFSRAGAGGIATLTAQLSGAAHAIRLADPDAGDTMLIVPARPGRGLLTPRRFVELEALPSAAGLAIVPYADDLRISVKSDLIEVSRPAGLTLSTASGIAPEPTVQIQRSGQGPAFIDFANWGGNSDDLYGTERDLRAAAAKLAESDANKARLQLARFLIAHQLAPEALGVIGVMQTSDPKLANDAALNAMKGVADYMIGRYADARVALASPQLDNDPHAALWRGLTEAKLERWGDARRDLAAAESALDRYPQQWITQARLARATAGLAVGDIATASDAMNSLGGELPPRDAAEAKLLSARIQAARGYMNEAIAALKVLQASGDAAVAAEASYLSVDTELAAGHIKPAAAIDRLETLRYRWRGDGLELRTLRKLGSLYFSQRRWREGLGVLRVAALNFASTDMGRGAQDDMRAAFEGLFLRGKADGMKPVESLSLFYDFIELTPIGADGDEMIRRLSDHLVAVDLLAPAEELLNHQVTKRLEGVARSVVATKLAAIYLLDHKPREALAAINDTRQTRLPDEVNEQRRLLEARALAALKQYDMAIDLVADDDSTEAKRMRADIYWESANWTLAAAKLDESLGVRWQTPGALADAERADVMRTAIAYSLANDDASLARLRSHYLAKMNASPDASAFAVVTEPIEKQGVAFRELARQIGSVDTLQRFMADFRKQAELPVPHPTRTAAN